MEEGGGSTQDKTAFKARCVAAWRGLAGKGLRKRDAMVRFVEAAQGFLLKEEQ